jgi:P-type conjugative transfer protein TrbJ
MIRSGLLVFVLGALPPPVGALFGAGDIVYDPSNFSQNILTAARALQSNINEALQIANQLRQIEMEVRNLAAFPQSVWGDVQGDIRQLTSLMESGQAISYAMRNLSGEFQRLYPGYKAPENYEEAYGEWTNNTLAGAQKALEAANEQNAMFSAEFARSGQIEALSDTAEGQMEALQAGNMLAAEVVGQLQKLRQLQMAEMQAQSAYMATEIEGQAAEKAAVKKWLDSGKNYVPVN